MDYLDPKKKKLHKIRISVGYGLFAVAIAIATLLLVFIANGYYIDRNTGQVIQNGLIFVDSKPTGAELYLNDELQRGRTDARLVIPGGASYRIDLRLEGYRDWTRTVQLEGGSLRRLTYARLIPQTLTSETIVNLRADPNGVSQSIDKRWLTVTYANTPLDVTLIDTESAVVTAQTLSIPPTLVSDPAGVLEVQEWADDNRFFIATFTSAAGVEYLLIDRENPDATQNLSQLFAIPDGVIDFQDRKRDRFFVFNNQTNQLFTATLNDGLSAEPVINEPLIAYKTFGTDWVLYITASEEPGMVEARFRRGDMDMELKKLQQSPTYLLQLAKLSNFPIMAVASPVENRAIVYSDPEAYLKRNENASIPVATTVMRVQSPQDLIISADSSTVLAYGPENVASHEFEEDRSYNFVLPAALDAGQEVRWIDGQHITFSSGGMQYIADFTGDNIYDLVASVPALGSFSDDAVEALFTVSPAVPAIAETPATPATLRQTSLLIAP